MKVRLLLLVFLILCSQLSSAIRISGYVIDNEGQSLSQVLVKSSLGYDITDERGIYHLQVSDADSVIFHKLGYDDMVLPAGDLPVKVILERTAIELSGKTVSAFKDQNKNIMIHLTPGDANSSGKTSLAGYIASETGLQFSGSRIAGSRQTLKVPGFDSRHTLVMLDGIPLNSAGEEFDLSRIPFELISEIELLPASGISGSGSMGAVLNLKTKISETPQEFEVGIGCGSFDHYSARVKYSRKINRFDLRTDLNYQQAENDFSYPVPDAWQLDETSLTRENNSFRQLDVSSFITYHSPCGNWSFKAYYTGFFRMLPGTINRPELFYKARISGNIMKFQTAWNYKWNNYEFISKVWHNLENTIYDNTRLKEPYDQYLLYYIYGKNYKQSSGIKPSVEWKLNDQIKLLTGGEILSESYKYIETTNESNSIPRIERITHAVFSEAEYKKQTGIITPWIKLSGRYDNSRSFPEEYSGNIISGTDLQQNVNLSASISRHWGFTLPSFYSLYWKGDTEAAGNPDLLPETSKGVIINASISYHEHSFSFSWRDDKLQNMIIWIQDFNYAWKPINLGEAKVENLEYRYTLAPLKQFSLSGTYTRTVSADKTRLPDGQPSAYYNKELIYTPDYQGNLALNWTPGNFILNLNMDFTGSQWSTRDQLSDKKLLSEYELYNCALGWKMKYKSFDITWMLQINNLLDNRYNIYEYMPQPGRNINFTIKIK